MKISQLIVELKEILDRGIDYNVVNDEIEEITIRDSKGYDFIILR